ncbi:MAG TPA: hypothetical protein PLG50_10955 [bacterium]|nr:hypothetical protein [bacterium]HQG46164.1 hypothetical protein [bacterium]HQI47171.1 hypothetical protein [bacterium]HQJ63530.1 hypothetical protein [bacterium]
MADLKKLGKKAISVFWREKEAAAQDLGPSPAPNLGPILSSPVSPTPIPPLSMPSATAPADTPFYKEIEQELAKNMPPAFAEFNLQLADLTEKFPALDQMTRDQLAFHAAQTALKARQQHLSVDHVLQALDTAIKALNQEEAQFSTQNEEGFKQKLAEVRQKINGLKQGIALRENRLVEIQKELDAFIAARNEEKKRLEAEKAQLLSDQLVTENEINQIEQKKREREANFHTALQLHQQNFAALRDRLAANLQKIK